MGKYEKKLARRIARHAAQLKTAQNDERLTREEIKNEKSSIEICKSVTDWGVISPNVVKGLIACCEERIGWNEYFLGEAIKKQRQLEAAKFY